MEEFMEGSSQDPKIVAALSLYSIQNDYSNGDQERDDIKHEITSNNNEDIIEDMNEDIEKVDINEDKDTTIDNTSDFESTDTKDETNDTIE